MDFYASNARINGYIYGYTDCYECNQPKPYEDYCDIEDNSFSKVYKTSLDRCVDRAKKAYEQQDYEMSLEHVHEAAKKGDRESWDLIDYFRKNINPAFDFKGVSIDTENFYNTQYFKQKLITANPGGASSSSSQSSKD